MKEDASTIEAVDWEGVYDVLHHISQLRVGYFVLDISDVDRFPEESRKNMGNFIILSARHVWKKAIEYVAISPLFEEVDSYHKIPVYAVDCISSDVGISVTKTHEWINV